MQDINYIGIGASAGGLNVLKILLSHIPVPSHSIYIIAQHYSAEKKSTLSELLNRVTEMDVIEATQNIEFLAGKVYIVASNMTLSEDKNSRLCVVPSPNTTPPQPNIDDIFSFLAKFGANRSIGVLLSGSGHDGTQGLKAIQEAGGVTLVQSPKEADYSSMPQSAIDSMVVDVALELRDIAKVIGELDFITPDEMALEAIRVLLINYNNFDLNKYKENTILRRIYKRMLLLQIDRLKDYTRYLIKNSQELQHLYENIFIGVTGFFRDKEAFTALEYSLENLIINSPDKKELRVWVTACATGEEAYTIAILIEELLQKSTKQLSWNIFASDIDAISLVKARQGIYTFNDIEAVKPYLLEKYFIQKDESYIVSQKLRERIVFTQHDLLNEPPFLKMDLITCRNALIYFEQSIQKEIFTMFHYALNPQGILFLGISEALPKSMNFFTLINSKWKIFVKESSVKPPKLAPRFYKMFSLAKTLNDTTKSRKKNQYSTIETSLKESIFELFSSSLIVINRHNEIVYTKGKVPYLEFSDGFASLNIFKKLHQNLHIELRDALDKSRKTDEKVVSKFVEIENTLTEQLFVRITVTPFSYQANEALSLLTFEAYKTDEMVFDIDGKSVASESNLVHSLQSQLSQLKAQMHRLQDEVESSSENMQMINEELQSSNEELQASNEEFETANEELQSTNEELNESYRHIDLLQQHYNIILESSMDGILGLDMQERHTFVNDAALKMLGYTREELIGKRGHAIWHHTRADGTPFPASECPILNVLKSAQAVRGQDLYWRRDGSSFEVEFSYAPMMENSQIKGVVVTFHDISKKKALEMKIRYEQSLIKHYFDATQAFVVVLNTEGNIELLNKRGADILQTDSSSVLGENWFSNFIDVSQREELQKFFDTLIHSKPDSITPYTNEVITINGEKRLIYWTNTPLYDENNTINGLISTGIDITGENALKMKLDEQEEMMIAQSRQAAMGDMIAMIAHQWRQPLSVISMEVNNLEADLELENELNKDDLSNLIKNISSQTEHLSQTIEDFKNFFEPNKSKEVVGLKSVFKNVKTLLLKSLENNNIAFVLKMQENYQLLTYKNELIQVLINIILNAKDAIVETGILDGEIKIVISVKDRELSIQIYDNGGGISADIYDKIAEPYVSSKGKNGTGLGLYMSSIIVQKHLDGRLTWKNIKNGACFSVLLPFQERDNE